MDHRHPSDDPPHPVVTRDVVVVVVTWRGVEFLGDCLRSLGAQTLEHRVLVVDNASDDGTADLLRREWPATEVLRTDRNLGFAGGVAAALAVVTEPFVALLNDDAVADPTWLEELTRALSRSPEVAAATGLVLLGDGATVNNAGNVLVEDLYGGDRGYGADPARFSSPDGVFGFCGGSALLRRSAVLEVGGMAGELFLYYEDTDLSWRLRLAGHQISFAPRARTRHRHSASSDQTSRSFARYNERNRLLVLVRCAPASDATWQLVKFVLVTASISARHLRRPRSGTPWQQHPGLRLAVLGEFALHLPRALRRRRQIGRTSVVSRDQVLADWGPGRTT